MPETNTLAYYENLYITDKKRFITFAPGVDVRKLVPPALKLLTKKLERFFSQSFSTRPCHKAFYVGNLNVFNKDFFVTLVFSRLVFST